MSDQHGNLLGKELAYPEHYDPSLLQPIARSLSRQSLGDVSFKGCDLWTAYEISYLNAKGKPCVAIAEFLIPALSPFIIESKSFKYYLNSFNQERFDSQQKVVRVMTEDLSAAAGASVEVKFFTVDEFAQRRQSEELNARLIDGIDVEVDSYSPSSDLLKFSDSAGQGVLCSHLLKTNCPVTGQPDWASVWIGYEGMSLDEHALLSYLISFRQHQDFHEHCVERIYSDLWASGKLKSLWVYARYTRRGGLDINPFRSSGDLALPQIFAGRQ